MSARPLRVVANDSLAEPYQTQGVRLRLGEILPILTQASLAGSTWLSDFADDEIVISTDLAIILARLNPMPGEKVA